MKGNDAVLALLQDIKDILYGIALLVLGGILCVAGILIGDLAMLLLFFGIAVCIAGIFYARHGHRHHEVVENPDAEPKN